MREARAVKPGEDTARGALDRQSGMPNPRFRSLAAGLLLALCAAQPGALAQTLSFPALPGLPKPAAAPASAAASAATGAAADDALRARLKQDLDDTRGLSAALSGGTGGNVVPPGITDEEVALAGRRLVGWIFALEGQLRSLDGLVRAQADKDDAVAANAAWTGFPDKPPYSILRAEDLAQQVDALKARVEAANVSRNVGGRELEVMQQDMKRSAEAQRRAEETARARPDDPAAAWRARAAGWSASAVAASTAAILRDKELSDAKAEVDTERLRLLERQLKTVNENLSFTEADLQQVRRNEQAREARLDKAAAAAQTLADQRSREAATAERALQALRTAVPAPTPARLDAAEAQMRALNAAVDTARRQSESLAAQSPQSNPKADAWE